MVTYADRERLGWAGLGEGEPHEHVVYEDVLKSQGLCQEAIISDNKPESSLYDFMKVENH